jgi:hypothetical protein
MPWSNGEIPYDVVSVVLDSGTDENGFYELRCTPAFAARWKSAKAYALAHFGKTFYARTGWNIYRPLFSQRTARTNACNEGNCSAAAYPGSSSHGGDWNGRVCLAVDVDPNGLSWAQIDEAMTAAGFSAGLITAAISSIPGGEPWHYIDFNAFGPVPADMDATPVVPPIPEEEYMPIHLKRENGGDTFTVVPAAYVKHHPSEYEGNLAGFITTREGDPKLSGAAANTRGDFVSLNDADLSKALWDLGFPELGANLGKLPRDGGRYDVPGKALTDTDVARIIAGVATALATGVTVTAGVSKADVESAIKDGLGALILKAS